MRPAGRNLFPLGAGFQGVHVHVAQRAHECEAWRVISHKRAAFPIEIGRILILSLSLDLPRAYQTFQPANGSKFPSIDVFLVVITRRGDRRKNFEKLYVCRYSIMSHYVQIYKCVFVWINIDVYIHRLRIKFGMKVWFKYVNVFLLWYVWIDVYTRIKNKVTGFWIKEK